MLLLSKTSTARDMGDQLRKVWRGRVPLLSVLSRYSNTSCNSLVSFLQKMMMADGGHTLSKENEESGVLQEELGGEGGEEGLGSVGELVKRSSGDSLNSMNLDLTVFS